MKFVPDQDAQGYPRLIMQAESLEDFRECERLWQELGPCDEHAEYDAAQAACYLDSRNRTLTIGVHVAQRGARGSADVS